MDGDMRLRAKDLGSLMDVDSFLASLTSTLIQVFFYSTSFLGIDIINNSQKRYFIIYSICFLHLHTFVFVPPLEQGLSWRQGKNGTHLEEHGNKINQLTKPEIFFPPQERPIQPFEQKKIK
jgi:hypothetical protein